MLIVAEYLDGQDAEEAFSSMPVDAMASVLRSTGAALRQLHQVSVPAFGDVYLPNILVDAQGRFRALLDLEHVRWVDPAMDFVKPAMWMFEGRPEWADAFADGYGIAKAQPPCWPERLSVATGLELLTGVDYWTRVRDEAMREDYLRRLRAWVRSDGVRHVWSSVTT